MNLGLLRQLQRHLKMSDDKLLRCKTTVKLVKMEKNDESVLAYTSETLSLLSFYGKSLPKVSRQMDKKNEVSSPGSSSDDNISRQKSFLRGSKQKVRPVLGSNNTTHKVKKVKRTTYRTKTNKGNDKQRKKEYDDQDFEKILEIEEKSELKRTRPIRAAFSRAAEQIFTLTNKCEMQGSENARKSPLKGTRKGTQRKAALEVASKMAKTEDFFRSLDMDIRNMNKNVYNDTHAVEYSSSEDEEEVSIPGKQNKKNGKQKENRTPPSSPKYCEYEKAAQEKITMRMQFLQSLDIFSEK